MGEVEQQTAAAAADAGQPAIDRQRVGAAVSKLVSASVGDIVLVLSRSAAHKHFSLADIECMILPPVVAGQFYVAEAAVAETGLRTPIAAVTWARVSADVDAKLRANAGRSMRLRPDEWTSGDICWLVDIVGDPRGLNVAMRWLLDGPFKERPANLVLADKDGKPRIETLQRLSDLVGGTGGAA